MTTGGDCAGLNAVIRAVVMRAVQGYGYEVLGIRRGTLGLLSDPPEVEVLTPDMFSGAALRTGGTMIGTTTRGNPFDFPVADGSRKDRAADMVAACGKLGLDAVIAIGGDGSFRILGRLAREHGLKVVGIPKTIDNDVVGTENSIGYITAVNVATEALDRLQTTAASHSRIMVLEVMGRDAGHIALSAGIAGGADIILIPEIPYRMDNLVARIESLPKLLARRFALVVVAEGCRTEAGTPLTQAEPEGGVRYGGIGSWLADRLAQRTGWETRYTILGHVQRGGMPSTTDRVLAAAFGVRAVDLAAAGQFGRVVVWQNRRVQDIPLAEAVKSVHLVDVDGDLVRTARGLGVSFGDEGIGKGAA
jgi:6-phosphofructokinase 1